MTRVLLADDHATVRAGLRLLLGAHRDLEVVGEAADGGAAVTQARALRPDVTLMDVRMPGTDGIEATARIVQGGWSRVLVLTSFGVDEHVSAALRAGADGYLLKTVDAAALADAVRRVAAGEAVLSPEVTRQVIGGFVAGTAGARSPAVDARDLETLTVREREVLAGLGRGLSNADLAAELAIGEATAKTHVSHVLTKLGCTSRMQAAVRARQHGLA